MVCLEDVLLRMGLWKLEFGSEEMLEIAQLCTELVGSENCWVL